ncbi:MAG: hypothetical protein ACI8P3_002303 [Saprospiraceae bacterium]|jgi:hypothetical protein
MKNKKFLSIVLTLMVLCQFSFAQGIENNGRDNGVTAGSVAEAPAPQAAVVNSEDDRDIPGNQAEEAVDYYYPLDLDIMNDDLSNSIHPAEMVQRLNDLTDLVESMRMAYEELRLENKVIRESFTNCCSSSELGLTAKDAYLLQNAPNPYTESAEIKYFVPSGLTSVLLEIRDVKGELLKSIPIKESGYGKISVGSSSEMIVSGTYIYSLSVNGQVIDSKVMIKTVND